MLLLTFPAFPVYVMAGMFAYAWHVCPIGHGPHLSYVCLLSRFLSRGTPLKVLTAPKLGLLPAMGNRRPPPTMGQASRHQHMAYRSSSSRQVFLGTVQLLQQAVMHLSSVPLRMPHLPSMDHHASHLQPTRVTVPSRLRKVAPTPRALTTTLHLYSNRLEPLKQRMVHRPPTGPATTSHRYIVKIISHAVLSSRAPAILLSSVLKVLSSRISLTHLLCVNHTSASMRPLSAANGSSGDVLNGMGSLLKAG
jgi:hypothetical protein